MQQDALEAEALTHAAREAADRVVAAIGEAGVRERFVDRGVDRGHAVQARVEREILAGRQLRIETGIVSEPADARAQRGLRRG